MRELVRVQPVLELAPSVTDSVDSRVFIWLRKVAGL